ncbi:MAG: SDR family oxidoreductase [Planctomycetes bacterium]|nr:SDR family oxidoreductase [Planctomycetota bacterium]MCB9889809.1 SDR family oxidoreductase [Planctomycetota bacterium]
MSSFDSHDSVALVTGAGRKNGIGKGIVDALLAAGARKVYVGVRNRAASASIYPQQDGRVQLVELDVTEGGRAEAVAGELGDVNLLVHNAGLFTGASALGDDADQRREFEVNVFGPLALTRAFAPVLKRNGGGAIVLLNSVASHFSFPLGASYSASKAALHSFTQALRRELAAQGTHVLGVYPGPIDTDMAEKIDMPKTSATEVGRRIVAALRDGEEDLLPDDTGAQMYAGFRADPKAFERGLAAGA